MRFLIPTPVYPDSFADNVERTLRAMGHTVITPQVTSVGMYSSQARQAINIVSTRIFGDRPTGEDRRLLALARDVRPDVLLAVTWDVHPEILADLGKLCPGRRILWWGDAPANSRRWGIANPEWDHVYVKDPDAAKKLALLGLRASLMHEAMNPTWHRIVAEQSTNDVCVAGNYYGFRQVLLRRLHRRGVPLALHGPRPPRWALPEIRRGWSGRYVAGEDKSRAFGQALACLNTFAIPEGNSLNCRAFEIAGAGGLQLLENRSIVEQCFEPGRELLTFDTFEALIDHIERARKHPQEMKAIRTAGARRALADHTYEKRLNRIIQELP